MVQHLGKGRWSLGTPALHGVTLSFAGDAEGLPFVPVPGRMGPSCSARWCGACQRCLPWLPRGVVVHVSEGQRVRRFPCVVSGLPEQLPSSGSPPADGGRPAAALHPPSVVEDAVTAGSPRRRGVCRHFTCSSQQASRPHCHRCHAAHGSLPRGRLTPRRAAGTACGLGHVCSPPHGGLGCSLL